MSHIVEVPALVIVYEKKLPSMHYLNNQTNNEKKKKKGNSLVVMHE
jgi:hypothetical protein